MTSVRYPVRATGTGSVNRPLSPKVGSTAPAGVSRTAWNVRMWSVPTTTTEPSANSVRSWLAKPIGSGKPGMSPRWRIAS